MENISENTHSKSNGMAWETVQVFEKLVPNDKFPVPGYVVVRVARAIVGNRERYSYTVGFRRSDQDRATPHFPTLVSGQGKIDTVKFAEALGEVLKEVETYIQEELQKAEDHYIAEKQSREQRRMTIPNDTRVQRHPGTVRQGKTEREREKNKNTSAEDLEP